MTAIQHAIYSGSRAGSRCSVDERGGDTNVKFGFKDMKNARRKTSTSRSCAG